MGQHDVVKRMDFMVGVRWSERAGRVQRVRDAGQVKKSSCTQSRLQDNISPGLGVSGKIKMSERECHRPSVDSARTTITSETSIRYRTRTRQAIAHGSQTAQGDCSLVDDDRKDRSRDRRDHPW
jgi:hypothetical protein